MAAEKDGQLQTVVLKQEVKMQINQALFERGVIPRENYELAKIKILQKST